MRALVRIDNPGRPMRRIRQRLAEQAFGRRGIAQPREHEVDRGAGGIDGSVEVAPTTLDTNVGLIDAPGFIGWLEMTAQPLLEFRTIALDPAPDCRVVCLHAAFAEQLFDIAERERVPKVRAHGAKNPLGFGLSPLEDRWSDCLFHDLIRLPAAIGQSYNTTSERVQRLQRTPAQRVPREKADLRRYRRGSTTRASVEGFNNKAKVTTRKAYGFRTFRAAEVALYHTLGSLPAPAATHRFF